MYKLIDIDKCNETEWRNYLIEHPLGNVFQSPEIYNIYKNKKNSGSLGVALLNNSRICGLVIGNYTDYYGVASRLSIQGGPIYDKPEYIPLLLSAIENLFGRFNLLNLIDIKNMWDSHSTTTFFNKLNYRYEDHLNYIINLSSSSENVWSSIPKNRRKNIRHAIKKGFIIRDVCTNDDLFKSYLLIKNTYNKVKMPVPAFYLFNNAYHFFKNSIIWKIAFLNDVPVATRLYLFFNDTIYDWYAGSLYNTAAEFSNELMVWNILEYGCTHGFKYFDFGGAGNPFKSYGPREFKRRFGGTQVNYGKYIRINHNHLFSTSKNFIYLKYPGLKNQI